MQHLWQVQSICTLGLLFIATFLPNLTKIHLTVWSVLSEQLYICTFVYFNLSLWGLTTGIIKDHPLILDNMCAKFDKNNQRLSVTHGRRDTRIEPQRHYYIPFATLCAGKRNSQTPSYTFVITFTSRSMAENIQFSSSPNEYSDYGYHVLCKYFFYLNIRIKVLDRLRSTLNHFWRTIQKFAKFLDVRIVTCKIKILNGRIEELENGYYYQFPILSWWTLSQKPCIFWTVI